MVVFFLPYLAFGSSFQRLPFANLQLYLIQIFSPLLTLSCGAIASLVLGNKHLINGLDKRINHSLLEILEYDWMGER